MAGPAGQSNREAHHDLASIPAGLLACTCELEPSSILQPVSDGSLLPSALPNRWHKQSGVDSRHVVCTWFPVRGTSKEKPLRVRQPFRRGTEDCQAICGMQRKAMYRRQCH